MIRTYHESSVTWNDPPWVMYMIRADGAMCPDGVRRIAYPSGDGIPDTYFSIPARVRISQDGARYTVSGYVAVETMDGYSTPSDDDLLTVKFHPYLYGKNGYRLASTDSLIQFIRREKRSLALTIPAHSMTSECETELERRGVVLVDLPMAPYGLGAFRTRGEGAGTFIRDERGYYA